MAEDLFFKAPGSALLVAMTAIGCAILGGIAIAGLSLGPRQNLLWIVLTIVLPLAILAIAACFSVTGYRVTPTDLYIRRLGWQTTIPLGELISAEVDPQAIEGSIRLWGNGGLFAFTGTFRSPKLGRYQAYATNFQRTAILRFPDRTVVVTPDRPDSFVRAVYAEGDRRWM